MAREHGVTRGDTVAILGNPCPEWVIADLAAQALGAITYGIYPTSASGEIRYLLQHGGAVLVVAEDQEHLDKILAVLGDCPRVRGVLVIDTRVSSCTGTTRPPLGRPGAAGSGTLRTDRDALARLAAAARAARIPRPSCTRRARTGHPKGALYRHGHHIAACADIIAHYRELSVGEHRVVAMLRSATPWGATPRSRCR